ncbi:FAD dependent oxidoreductase [Xylariales sp. PMI_506]|nr:FAD dependent oxidoreductase [Xylariales sp. PMI_506]
MTVTEKKSTPKEDAILIVGAGVFGLSTALELKRRGFRNVTVLDRYMPPVLDGSSVDISRIIRTDYADPLYNKMATEALELWKTEYKDYYYQPGFVRLTKSDGNDHYLEKSLDISRNLGIKIDEFPDANGIRKLYPDIPSRLDGLTAYNNASGGWANAEGAIEYLSKRCSLAGVSFVLGARGTVRSLVLRGDQVVGVNTAAGDPIMASRVILATGAWTGRLLPIQHATNGSGQPVGFIQLSADEAKRLEDMPVIMNMVTGMFVFPPSPGKHVLKIARHGYGFATRVKVGEGESTRTISAPKCEENVSASFLPHDADAALREGLAQLVPEFADRPWLNRRLCWYSDTALGDFIVDHHPTMDGLFVATGGSGHGFKFLPVLGQYIADCFENIAPQDLRIKWKLPKADGKNFLQMEGDGSRCGPPLRTLDYHEQAKL